MLATAADRREGRIQRLGNLLVLQYLSLNAFPCGAARNAMRRVLRPVSESNPPTTVTDARVANLAAKFEKFARKCSGVSPLYERLSLGIMRDYDLLSLAAEARADPVPNLLLAAVHYLLLAGERADLTDHYPDLVSVVACTDPYPSFRRFCLEHQIQLTSLIRSRNVQTNAVGRAAILVPCFALLAEAMRAPLAVIEVGASAGLLLAWDRYSYDYGSAGSIGPRSSPVQLHCQVTGEGYPNVAHSLPAVVFRKGLDLDPPDLDSVVDRRWLQALVWPDQPERLAQLEAAVEVVRRAPPNIVAGDAARLLPSVMDEAPREAVLCVFHSHSMYQFPEQSRMALLRAMRELGRRRPVFRIGLEAVKQRSYCHLELEACGSGLARRLAVTDDYGMSMHWVGPAALALQPSAMQPASLPGSIGQSTIGK